MPVNQEENESGISKFFKNLFGDDDNDAEKYSSAARNKVIVTVHAQSADEAERAADVLDDNGAADIDKDSDDNRYNKTGDANQSVKVIEEKLEVGKRNMQTGGKDYAAVLLNARCRKNFACAKKM